MTMTDVMADDEAPSDFVLACPKCGDKPGKGAGPNWLANHKKAKHPGENSDDTPTGQGMELTATEKKLAKDLQITLASPTLLLMALNMTDGMLVMNGTEDLVTALIIAARKSRKLKKFLTSVIEGVVWLAVGTAIANIVLPILDNHGIISVPTMRVQDKLGADMVVPGRSTPPPTQRPVNTSVPTSPFAPRAGAAVPDSAMGMNRAARRAVEPDGPTMPPDLATVAAQFGVDPDEVVAMAKKMGMG